MKFWLTIVCIFLFSNLIASKHLDVAREFRDNSDFSSAIRSYKIVISNSETHLKEYYTASLELADVYTDLGTHRLAIQLLLGIVDHLDNQSSTDYLIYAKTHQLLADNYYFLFLLDDFLIQIKKFHKYYLLYDSNEQIYTAIYYAYLSKYCNVKYDIDNAYNYSLKALEIYHNNKSSSYLVDSYIFYESHCFSIRNYDINDSIRKNYFDTLEVLVNDRFLKGSVKKARLIIGYTSIKFDHAYNTLSNPESKFSLKEQNGLIRNCQIDYEKGISILNKLVGAHHDYLPRYYDLQGMLFYANNDLKKSLSVNEKSLRTYAVNEFVSQGFVANNYRVMTSLRFKAMIISNLRKEIRDDKLDAEYLDALLLYEKLWEGYQLEQVQDIDDFISNMYNQNPYQYIYEYYADLFDKTKDPIYLEELHKYEEKSKYASLLISRSNSSEQKNKRIELRVLRNEIYTLLDEYYLEREIHSNDISLLSDTINLKISAYEEFRDGYSSSGDKHIPSLKKLKSSLEKNQAIVSYNYIGIGSNQLYCKLITSEDVFLFNLSELTEEVNYSSLVDTIFQTLKNSDIALFKANSYLAYRLLFEPLLNRLPDEVNELEIIAFPDIANLPFDLLISSVSATSDFRKLPYLVNKYSFSYSLSSSINSFNSSKIANSSSNNSIFSPVFKDDKSSLTIASKLAADMAVKQNAQLYSGDQATVSMFKKSLLEAEVVTLLSHGSSNKAMSGKDKGIYLQDGFLTMEEIYSLKSATKFLVLNACQTGLGYIDRGEGNVNLLRAFSAIGVNSILYSNWELDESASLRILDDFFTHLSRNNNKSEALRLSKLNYLSTCVPRYANPIYWAGMNIMGDNQSIVMAYKSDEVDVSTRMVVILGMSVLVLFVIYYRINFLK